MISSSYVNGSAADIPAFDPFNLFESDIDIIMDTVNTAYLEYKASIDEYNLSVEFFEASDDVKKDNVSGAKSNFVDKLGSAIIEVGKRALAFINNIISKIQDSLFGNKSDMAKVSALCKKNPDMADDINKAFREGKLQVADLKNIKELEAAYDEIMRLAKQENVDPNTLRGKWANAKKKFGNLSESDIIKGTTAVIGVAAAGTGLVLSLSKLPDAIASFGSIKSKIKEANDKAELAAVNLEKAMKDLDYTNRTQEDRVNKAHSDALKAADDAKFADETHDARRREAVAKSMKTIHDLNQSRKSSKDDLKKKSADASKAQSEAKYAKDTLPDRTSKAHSDAVKAKQDLGKVKPVDAIRSLLNASESVNIDINTDGYMTESASAAVASVINSIHADMVKILTALGGFNFKTLSKAQAIVNAAIKGYNKPIKGSEKDKEASEE